jgi:hypothetical protein
MRGLSGSQNRVLKGIFGTKREEMAGGWIRLHNEELHNLYALPSRETKSRRVRWAGHEESIAEMGNACKILVVKPEGKRPRRWEDNIRIYLQEIVSDCVYWIHMAHDREEWRVL